MEFNYLVIQFNRLSWHDFVRHPNPVASALMAKMNIAPADRPFVKVEGLRIVTTLHLDPARTQLRSGFVDTYLRLTPEEEEQHRALLATIEPTEREAIMEITTSWEE